MRTTLTLEDDVAALLKRVQEESKESLKEVVNRALREGLQRLDQPVAAREPYRTKVHDAGECYFPNLDNIHEVLDEVEGPWRR